MEQILQEILQQLGKINNRLDNLEQEVKDNRQNQVLFENRITQELRDTRQNQVLFENRITQELRDTRQNQVLFENHITKQFNAIQDTQKVALDKWLQSMDILERVENLLNDREAEHVAVDAQLIDHEGRINTLEQKAG